MATMKPSLLGEPAVRFDAFGGRIVIDRHRSVLPWHGQIDNDTLDRLADDRFVTVNTIDNPLDFHCHLVVLIHDSPVNDGL